MGPRRDDPRLERYRARARGTDPGISGGMPARASCDSPVEAAGWVAPGWENPTFDGVPLVGPLITLAEVDGDCEHVVLPGHIEAGATVPCPDGDHDHHVRDAVHTMIVENITSVEDPGRAADIDARDGLSDRPDHTAPGHGAPGHDAVGHDAPGHDTAGDASGRDRVTEPPSPTPGALEQARASMDQLRGQREHTNGEDPAEGRARGSAGAELPDERDRADGLGQC